MGGRGGGTSVCAGVSVVWGVTVGVGVNEWRGVVVRKNA